MPGGSGSYSDEYDKRRQQKVKDVTARLVAKGMHPRSNGFMRAFYKAMRK